MRERFKCFIIQPFGKKKHGRTGNKTDNEKVYRALKGLENEMPDFPIAISRADTGKITNDDLHDHVVQKLSESDFCIADLTGQNPNVLYEAGYAKGLNLAIIIIVQDESDIPTDLKRYLYIKYDTARIEEINSNISRHFDRVEEDIKQRKENRTSHIRYYATRNEADIQNRILRARGKIDILQTNLVTIGTNYLSHLLTALRNNKSSRFGC